MSAAAASTWQRRAGRVPGRTDGHWWLVSAGPGRTDPSRCWPVCLQLPSSARTFPESKDRRTNYTTHNAPVGHFLSLSVGVATVPCCTRLTQSSSPRNPADLWFYPSPSVQRKKDQRLMIKAEQLQHSRVRTRTRSPIRTRSGPGH